MLIIDTHVHLYPKHNPSNFFDFAYKNLNSIVNKHTNYTSIQCILCLTETAKHNWFNDTSTRLASGETINYGHWSIQASADKNCITATSNTYEKVHLIQGYQIVTIEKLEVLALGLDCRIPDGLSLQQTIDHILKAGAMPVLPWGVGKWLGNRGTIITDLLKTGTASQIALGDNGGRPGAFPYPDQFRAAEKLGIPIFPGTDPLPIAGEENKVGRCGLVYSMDLDEGPISQQVIKLLKNRKIGFEKEFVLETNFRFLINQILMRLKK